MRKYQTSYLIIFLITIIAILISIIYCDLLKNFIINKRVQPYQAKQNTENNSYLHNNVETNIETDFNQVQDLFEVNVFGYKQHFAHYKIKPNQEKNILKFTADFQDIDEFIECADGYRGIPQYIFPKKDYEPLNDADLRGCYPNTIGNIKDHQLIPVLWNDYFTDYDFIENNYFVTESLRNQYCQIENNTHCKENSLLTRNQNFYNDTIFGDSHSPKNIATIFVVQKAASRMQVGSFGFYQGNLRQNHDFFLEEYNQNYINFVFGNDFKKIPSTYTAKPVIMSAVKNINQISVYQNGNLLLNEPFSANLKSGNFQLSFTNEAEVAEVIVYKEALSDSQRLAVEKYLLNKWHQHFSIANVIENDILATKFYDNTLDGYDKIQDAINKKFATINNYVIYQHEIETKYKQLITDLHSIINTEIPELISFTDMYFDENDREDLLLKYFQNKNNCEKDNKSYNIYLESDGEKCLKDSLYQWIAVGYLHGKSVSYCCENMSILYKIGDLYVDDEMLKRIKLSDVIKEQKITDLSEYLIYILIQNIYIDKIIANKIINTTPQILAKIPSKEDFFIHKNSMLYRGIETISHSKWLYINLVTNNLLEERNLIEKLNNSRPYYEDLYWGESISIGTGLYRFRKQEYDRKLEKQLLKKVFGTIIANTDIIIL